MCAFHRAFVLFNYRGDPGILRFFYTLPQDTSSYLVTSTTDFISLVFKSSSKSLCLLIFRLPRLFSSSSGKTIAHTDLAVRVAIYLVCIFANKQKCTIEMLLLLQSSKHLQKLTQEVLSVQCCFLPVETKKKILLTESKLLVKTGRQRQESNTRPRSDI